MSIPLRWRISSVLFVGWRPDIHSLPPRYFHDTFESIEIMESGLYHIEVLKIKENAPLSYVQEFGWRFPGPGEMLMSVSRWGPEKILARWRVRIGPAPKGFFARMLNWNQIDGLETALEMARCLIAEDQAADAEALIKLRDLVRQADADVSDAIELCRIRQLSSDDLKKLIDSIKLLPEKKDR